MKLERLTLSTLDVDLRKERARLRKCLKGAQLKRQLAIVAAFEAQKWAKAYALMDALPECPRYECPEVEFVWPEIHDVLVTNGLAHPAGYGAKWEVVPNE